LSVFGHPGANSDTKALMLAEGRLAPDYATIRIGWKKITDQAQENYKGRVGRNYDLRSVISDQ
jgi:hypothetical protein